MWQIGKVEDRNYGENRFSGISAARHSALGEVRKEQLARRQGWVGVPVGC